MRVRLCDKSAQRTFFHLVLLSSSPPPPPPPSQLVRLKLNSDDVDGVNRSAFIHLHAYVMR